MTMRFLVLLSVITTLVDGKSGEGLLRGTTIEQGIEISVGEMLGGEKKDVTDEERRKLPWTFVPPLLTFDDDEWYKNADDTFRGGSGDGDDYLRDSDVCYQNGMYSRDFCPEPPNCNFSGKNGHAKLCVMRMPICNGDGFHVLAMKCIPTFGDCEKCMCGGIDRRGVCRRIDEDDVDDSRIDVRCSDPCHVTMMGHTFDFTANRNEASSAEDMTTPSPTPGPEDTPIPSPITGPGDMTTATTTPGDKMTASSDR